MLLAAVSALLLGLPTACSHDYEASTLDLSFYQWNFWIEEGAPIEGSSRPVDEDGRNGSFRPNCGWDDMHRGVGKLVRIPATVGEYFSDDYAGVSWFHARFTLPELWAGRKVSIEFAGVNGNVQVFLEGKLVGEHPLSAGPFSLDVSEHIFYTRDNHLCIRVADPRPGEGGLTGKVFLKSSLTGEADDLVSGDNGA